MVQKEYPSFSGRMAQVLPYVTITDLKSYIQIVKNYGIAFNYTLNPSCTGNVEFTRKGVESIIELIKVLADIGVSSITVSSPSILELVKFVDCDMEIKASAICNIQSLEKAQFYEREGCKRLVLDPDSNRNFSLIRILCQTIQADIEIIVNNVCTRNCAYKNFHYNHDAHCTSTQGPPELKDYFSHRCSLQKARSPEAYLKQNWIRPEDIKFYKDCGVKHFKIQGRQNSKSSDLVATLKGYFSGHYEGGLYDLLMLFSPYNNFYPFIDNKSLDGYLEKIYNNEAFCQQKCTQCWHCANFVERCMNMEQLQKLNHKATLFYTQVDDYTQFIKSKK